MRILLIAPSQKAVYGKAMAIYPPLGLLYIAAVLEQAGHTVRLLDVDAEQAWGSRFMSAVRAFDPQVVGISGTTPVYPDGLRLAAQVKAEYDVPIIFGGVHATVEAFTVIQEPVVDFVVTGEAEVTMPALIAAIESGASDFSQIDGVIWQHKGDTQVNAPRSPVADLATLPFPAVHLLPDLGAYRPPDALRFPFMTIMTSRGCPARCTFCSTENMFGKKVRMRWETSVVDEMAYLADRFGIREIHIADDVFTVNRKRVLAICREIEARQLDLTFFFMNGLRADQVDQEMLEALRAVGFQNVGFGVETSDDSMREDIQKRLELERVIWAVDAAKKLGFSTWLFFIIGLWGETEASVRATIDFAKKVRPDYAKFFILKPLPGTPLFQKLEAENCILTRDWEQYGLYGPPVHRLPTMDPEQMVYWHRRANREFYMRPRRVLAQLQNIRSWTQFKANLSALSFLKHVL